MLEKILRLAHSPRRKSVSNPSSESHPLTHYVRLHDAGVYHNSAKPKHWLRRGPNNIRIIDYEKARVTAPCVMEWSGKDHWNRWRTREVWSVANQLEVEHLIPEVVSVSE